MLLENINVAVVGLGKSGFALIDFLEKNGSNILAFDKKTDYEKEELEKYSEHTKFVLGNNPTGDEDVKLVIVSPGVPMDMPFVKKFKARNIELIGEIEFAYRFAKGTFIGITGTNGKTTTTTLVGEIFKACDYDTRVVGNIGNPIISEVGTSTEETVFVCELSSFQLETVRDFCCHIGTIINITPDHLDRHKTFENYAYYKARIYNNQTPNDFAIVNDEDEISKALTSEMENNKIYFSVHKKLEKGIYMNDGKIYSSLSGEEKLIMDRSEIFLKGDHNVENVLAALGIAIAYDLDLEKVKQVLRDFKGVEHRLEYVKEINGVTYINDSKGTNPDASCKAIASFDNIILIAGGYDKGSDYEEYLTLYKERGKALIVMGATADKIINTAERLGIDNIYKVESMQEAVQIAYKIAEPGYVVLLSPACASWGMYKNYEIRGKDFKSEVEKLC